MTEKVFEEREKIVGYRTVRYGSKLKSMPIKEKYVVMITLQNGVKIKEDVIHVQSGR